MEMTNDEIKKELAFANMVMGVINNTKVPMLIYDGEKEVVKKALRKYMDELESNKMGMTIDEHVAQLKKLKSFHNGSYGASINFTIDTMRKYQKIEQIVRETANDDWIGRKIKKVVEDGKID